MSEMIERVARSLAASDEAEPLFGCACLGKESPHDFACPCKMRNARRRAKAAIEAMSEWHSIETAPKDGTWILLYADGKQFIAHWDTGAATWLWGGKDDFFGEYGHLYDEPTHWMPLPEPPK